MRKDDSKNTIYFDSLADMGDYVDPKHCLGNASMKWFGGVDPATAVAMLKTGDFSQVATAEKLLDKFNTVAIETAGTTMDVGPAGFMPCVPEYLGGSPEAMYCMADIESTMAPLKIIVDTSSSAGIEQETLQKRGASILAAVMALSVVRPVSLEIACTLDCSSDRNLKTERWGSASVSFVRCQINSSPLDLGSACYALCHSGFTRRVVYGLARHEFGSPLGWGSLERGANLRDPRNPKSIEALVDLLDEDQEHTLFIPAIQLVDELVKEPEQWLTSVLARYGAQGQ